MSRDSRSTHTCYFAAMAAQLLAESCLGELSGRLNVPLELLQAVAADEQHCVLLERVAEYVTTKQDEAEEYESVLAELSATISQRDNEAG